MARTFSATRKWLYSATNLKLAKWHRIMIQRNTEGNQGPQTLMKILHNQWFDKGGSRIEVCAFAEETGVSIAKSPVLEIISDLNFHKVSAH
jgi:hypothetical protein